MNETLKELHQMVCRVKQDREVSLEYMKVIEWERMLREEGREEEMENTAREKERADRAEKRAALMETELTVIKKALKERTIMI